MDRLVYPSGRISVAGKNFDPMRIWFSSGEAHALCAPDDGIDLAVANRIRNALVDNFEAGHGVVVLSGLDGLSETEGRQAVLSVSGLLGSVIPQNAEGDLVKEVRDRGTSISQVRTSRYSESRHGGDLHTDGAEAPLPAPDYFALYCARQAKSGGALQLVHVNDILRALESDRGYLETLMQPFHFDRRGDERTGEAPTTEKPVLFRQQDGRIGITYLRSYIVAGHGHANVPSLSSDQIRALDALDAVVMDPRYIYEDFMRPGELAIFDNCHVLHGRTSFEDDRGAERLLFRTWIRVHPDVGPTPLLSRLSA
jgi:alpha-ketoglutarate-dependent taurine dioxygenase